MNKNLTIKITNYVIFFCFLLQILVYFYNQKSVDSNFDLKNISIENFSSIILTKSGITKIGSKKLNKISDKILFLEGLSYMENENYQIFGNNISINLETELSSSDSPVKTINSLGEMQAEGFENNDLEGKIFFMGSAVFKFE
jgi:hypothetical protein